MEAGVEPQPRGPDWMPITPKTGALFHADSQLGTTLRYPYEVREASGYFEEIVDIKIPADMRKLAEHILDSKATDFDPSKFVDQYEVALVDLLKKKEAGVQPQKAASAAPERRVVNLMDALRKSIETETPRKPAAGQSATRRQSARKRA